MHHLVKNFSIPLGIILIWRGVWLLLDFFDFWILGNSHVLTAVAGIVVGIIILYLPDHNLDSLERL